ncbi:1-pyrroline-5-carboxylate dehydrogenase, partial [Microbacterium sp. HMWF026]
MSPNDPRATGPALSSDLAARAASRAAAFGTRAVATTGPRRPALPTDADGAAFVAAAADAVLRPESLTAAAAALHRLAEVAPASLPWFVRGALQLGGAVAPVLPTPAVPLARRALRDVLAGLVLDARSERLDADLAAAAADETVLDLRLDGPRVAGESAARRRLDGIRSLIARDDVARVSIAIGDVVAPRSPWAFEADVQHAAERVLPVFLDAAARGSHVTLVATGRDDLDLTVAVLTRVLEEPRLREAAAGVGLPVAVPETLGAVYELAAWARVRAASRRRGS